MSTMLACRRKRVGPCSISASMVRSAWVACVFLCVESSDWLLLSRLGLEALCTNCLTVKRYLFYYADENQVLARKAGAIDAVVAIVRRMSATLACRRKRAVSSGIFMVLSVCPLHCVANIATFTVLPRLSLRIFHSITALHLTKFVKLSREIQ